MIHKYRIYCFIYILNESQWIRPLITEKGNRFIYMHVQGGVLPVVSDNILSPRHYSWTEK